MDKGVATLEFLRKLYVDEKPLPPYEPFPVSICTPIYNAMPFIQTYLEHILMYDWPQDLTSIYFAVSGNDNTEVVLKEFAKTYGDDYKRIKVKYLKQSLGGELPHVRNVVQARNLMVQWSRPDMVLFNDCDNFSPPVCIRRLYDGLRLGASGAAGIYMFRQFEEGQHRIGFTSFFLKNKKMRHLAMMGYEGLFPLEIFGKRLWMDAVSCGCFLVKRELLNQLKLFVPWGTPMTDDTAFCLKARELGHKFIGDFGLMLPHWGYEVSYGKYMGVKVRITPEMDRRRAINRESGAYVHPDVTPDNEARIRKYIDFDKIEELVKDNA